MDIDPTDFEHNTNLSELIKCLKKENATLNEKYTELYQEHIKCLEQNRNYREELNKLAPSPYSATINKLKITITPSPPGLPPSSSPPVLQSDLPIPPILSIHNEIDELNPPTLVLPSSYSLKLTESSDSLTPDGMDDEKDDENHMTLSPEIKPIKPKKQLTIDTKRDTSLEKRFKTNICKHWEKHEEYKKWMEDKPTYEIMANDSEKQIYLNSFKTGDIPIPCKYGDNCRYAHGKDKLECAYCKKKGHTLIKCPELEGRNRFTETSCQPVFTNFATRGAGDRNTDWRLKT